MQSLESPAHGLTSIFLTMASARGFATPQDNTAERAEFESVFADKIGDLIERGVIGFGKDRMDDRVQMPLGFKASVVPRAVPPQCLELKIVQGKIKPDSYPAERDVSNDALDKLTICFACFFRRAGAVDTRYIETLNQVRALVADGLELLGYRVCGDGASCSPRRSLWSRHEEWGCLARADGAHFTEIITARSLALKSPQAAR